MNISKYSNTVIDIVIKCILCYKCVYIIPVFKVNVVLLVKTNGAKNTRTYIHMYYIRLRKETIGDP